MPVICRWCCIRSGDAPCGAGARRYGIRRQNGGGLSDFEEPSPVGFQSRKPLAILLSEYASARKRAFESTARHAPSRMQRQSMEELGCEPARGEGPQQAFPQAR